MSRITTTKVINLIDEASEDLKLFAQKEEQQDNDYRRGLKMDYPGWSYGAAKSAALYMVDGLRHIDTSDVDWPKVAEHLDKILPVN